MTRFSVWRNFSEVLILVAILGGSTSHAQTLPEFKSTLFAGSGVCARCHFALQDTAGNDVSMDRDWRSTMMAHSAKDPFFRAKIRSEIVRFPHLKSVIENKCLTCHTSMARTQAAADNLPIAFFEDGFLDPAHSLHTMALDGVSCTLCHQILEQQPGEQRFSGSYLIDLLKSAPDRTIHGPYPNPFTNNMRLNAGFTPVHAPHIAESNLCGTCHVLYTPVLNETGEIVGEFPEQTIYLEWLHSRYAKEGEETRSCRDCHMPPAAGGVVISQAPRFLSPRDPFSRHHFVGGNAPILAIFRSYWEELSGTASREQLQATLDRTVEQLETRTATMEITDVRIIGNFLEVDLQIISNVGHKFPAGFPSRRAWVHFIARDNIGNVVFESGRFMADGRIQGNDADANLQTFEPHREIITSPDQVPIYEGIMQDTKGNVTYTLLSASSYAKDNRLLPHGFDPTSASADIAAIGDVSRDADFSGGGDRIRYRIPLSGESGPFAVEAELLYQTIAYPFLADLAKDDNLEYLQLAGYYEEASPKAVLIDHAVREGIFPDTPIPDWPLR
ncbi:MAG TPA: multiheme c-type cytochrome [bacterium]|nr:multiheme c-type cytochrome [bacterium]